MQQARADLAQPLSEEIAAERGRLRRIGLRADERELSRDSGDGVRVDQLRVQVPGVQLQREFHRPWQPGRLLPHLLDGPVGIANPDYTKFTDKDGKPLPFYHTVRKATDGTLTPWQPMGVCAAADGSVYVMTIAPFTLLKFGPEQMKSEPRP